MQQQASGGIMKGGQMDLKLNIHLVVHISFIFNWCDIHILNARSFMYLMGINANTLI